MIKIDAETRKIEWVFQFSDEEWPREIKINGTRDTIYFINKNIYRHPVLSENEPELIIKSPYTGAFTGGYYGLGIDPISSEIYVADAIDYVQRGMIYRFTGQGTKIDSFRAGVAPGKFCFTTKKTTK